MDEFVVEMSAHAPARRKTVPDAYADALMDASADYDGIVSAGPTSWTLTFTVAAKSTAEALSHAWELLAKFATALGPTMPDWPVLDVRATRADIVDAEQARPNVPDLVSGPEAAAILGVSKARVHQLAAENSHFPKPLYVLAAGSLWTREAIEAFVEQWERKPGRPRKVTA